MPLYNALEVGCTSVEADVWLQGGDLLVGHSKDSLKPSRTLQSLYINPLLSILGHQNPALNLTGSHTNKSAPLSGIYASSPSTSLTLLVDLKTSSANTLPVLTQQLSPLRSQGLVIHFDGYGVTEGPITVVGTGHADFRALVSNTTYRDIFFDAPLDQLWGEDTPGDATAYTADNSYYASASFAASIRGTWLGGLAPRQMYKIRGQIKGAHERGLKVRYWDTPGWPRGLRNHVWDVLWKEGADVLNVDDLVGARDFCSIIRDESRSPEPLFQQPKPPFYALLFCYIRQALSGVA